MPRQLPHTTRTIGSLESLPATATAEVHPDWSSAGAERNELMRSVWTAPPVCDGSTMLTRYS